MSNLEPGGQAHYSSSKGGGVPTVEVLAPNGLQAPLNVDPTPVSDSIQVAKSKHLWTGFQEWWHSLSDSCTFCLTCSCLPCRKKVPATVRRVIPNNKVLPDNFDRKDLPNREFATNRIKTTKYTLLTFLPKNLFEQFHRFANLYFIFLVVLNFVPQIEAFAKELSMIPILFVIGVTAVKDAFEDFRRYRSDQKINSSTCRVWNPRYSKYVKAMWLNVGVGDFVHLSSNEIIPADILLVKSTDSQGICYVETSNLDGESNLKQRSVVTAMKDKQGLLQIAPKVDAVIECELPNSLIHRFYGSLIYPNGTKEAIGKNNLLLRGCEIRNTDFVEGIVVYAGPETKAMMNNSGPRYKRSELERLMNWDVVWCVVLLLVLCVIGAVGSGMWLASFDDPNEVIYLPFAAMDSQVKPEMEAFLNFWSYIIILQVMIPISLYVSIEIIKLGQIYFIVQDKELYHEETDKRIQCRALNIPEELGQISYVMSDKTGTLTENKMVFKRCAIAGYDFGSSEPTEDELRPIESLVKVISDIMRDERQAETPHGQCLIDFFINMTICNTVVVNAHAHKDNLDASGNFSGTSFQPGPLMQRSTGSTLLLPRSATPTLPNTISNQSSPVQETVLNTTGLSTVETGEHASISQNNSTGLLTVDTAELQSLSVPSSPRSPRRQLTLTSLVSFAVKMKSRLSPRGEAPAFTPVPLNPIYEAESPDELALVLASKTHGYRLLKRDLTHVMLEKPNGDRQKFELLHTLPFDSVRKRMSVIVRNEDDSIVLYSKGADSVMLELIDPDYISSKMGSNFFHKSQENLNKYSSIGLRTLCLCKRVLSEDEYSLWLNEHLKADNAIEDREAKVAESAIEIEKQFNLLGVTAIEDKLQDGVPETIESLRRAGIKVWVLTGDKLETAINIAFSCRLFSQGMSLITITEKTADLVQTRIALELTKLEDEESREDAAFTRRKKPKYGLVVDGHPLSYCIHDDTIEQFVQLVQKCNCVLVCRATPNQKAQVVRIVKEKLSGKTLAIGDGANDVAMIQASDVGVGISGQEGMQAVMSSDYALPRFSFLKRVLLVHGHWCYDRLARTILYFFYKNALFVFTLFWYQLFNGFSSQVVFDPWYLTFYNLIFTSMPPVLMGVFDQDCTDDILMANPKLYNEGRMSTQYRSYSFWVNMADALWQSMVIFFVTYWSLVGSDVGMWEFGFVIFSALVYVNLAHFAVELRSWTWPMLASVILSLLVFVAFSLVYNALAGPKWMVTDPPYWVAQTVMQRSVYWLLVLIIVVLAILPRVAVKTMCNTIYPSDVLLCRVKVKAKTTNDKPAWNSVFGGKKNNVSPVGLKEDEIDESRGHANPIV